MWCIDDVTTTMPNTTNNVITTPPRAYPLASSQQYNSTDVIPQSTAPSGMLQLIIYIEIDNNYIFYCIL